MVTETHEDVEKEYLNLYEWIKHGIATDAIYLVANTWYHQNELRDYSLSVVRNKDCEYYKSTIGFKRIKPLNKW